MLFRANKPRKLFLELGAILYFSYEHWKITSTMYQLKPTKPQASYANFEIYYQQLGHLPYTRLSLDSIWTMAMSCTMKLLTSRKIGIDSIQHMPSLSRINKGYVKRKNLSSTGIGVPLRSTLVQKSLLFYKVLEKEHPKCLLSLITFAR